VRERRSCSNAARLRTARTIGIYPNSLPKFTIDFRRRMLQRGATRETFSASYWQMRPLLIHLQQNKAGLIADLAILALFLLLLAAR
jgi:hypothetical protein